MATFLIHHDPGLLEMTDSHGRTPLHICAMHGTVGLLSFFDSAKLYINKGTFKNDLDDVDDGNDENDPTTNRNNNPKNTSNDKNKEIVGV